MPSLRPVYDDGGIQLYLGDAQDVLPQLAPASVDLILSDPPYGIGYVSNCTTDRAMARPIAGDDSLNALRDALPLLDRVLRNDRHAYFFASPTRIGEATAAVGDVFKLKNLLVWDKGQQGTLGDLACGYSLNWEAILYAAKGRRPLAGPRPRSVYRYDWSAKRDPGQHPTVKPVGLLAWLMSKSTELGELVLDPFAGSGTTLRAAKDLGRRAIGIELDPEYCDRAIERLTR